MKLRLHQLGPLPWRTVLSVALVLGYLAFMGESIHCQYLADAQPAHHHSSSSAPHANSHQAHCLMANHGATATIHSAEVSNDPPTQHVAGIVSFRTTLPATIVVLSKVARGPPTA